MDYPVNIERAHMLWVGRDHPPQQTGHCLSRGSHIKRNGMDNFAHDCKIAPR